jgi:Na+/melibiose symporter-like transporter
MTEQEIKNYLESISRNLELIQKQTRGSKFTSLFTGMLSGFGSVIGAALALAIIGWILNFVGVIPALRNQANKIEQLLQTTQTYKPSSSNKTTQ